FALTMRLFLSEVPQDRDVTAPEARAQVGAVGSSGCGGESGMRCEPGSASVSALRRRDELVAPIAQEEGRRWARGGPHADGVARAPGVTQSMRGFRQKVYDRSVRRCWILDVAGVTVFRNADETCI